MALSSPVQNADKVTPHHLYGTIFSRDCRKPNLKKLQGNTEMTLPLMYSNYNFMQPYMPYLSHHTAPLSELLKKNHVYYQDDNTNITFRKLKSFISKAHSIPLWYYQRDLPITIQADASKHVLGNCLLQHRKPIAFSLKSLMDAKTRYTNIKWELLAIVYAGECFHTYPYGFSLLKTMTTSPWNDCLD